MENKIKLLFVEDERMLAEILADTLSERGFCVTLAADGEEALARWRELKPDIVVSDVMMPRMDGFTLIKRMRAEGYAAPVLFLTARSATEDVVKGFEVGGNDFLRKPFAIDELIVRLKALLGRLASAEDANEEFSIGRYRFVPAAGRLTIDGRNVTLSARESDVLAALCRNKGQVVESSGLLMKLWGDDTFFNLRSLNVFISRLRHHLSQDKTVEIVSVRGVGYKLRDRG